MTLHSIQHNRQRVLANLEPYLASERLSPQGRDSKGSRVKQETPTPAHPVCLHDEVVTVIKPAQKGSQGLLARERSLIRWGTG